MELAEIISRLEFIETERRKIKTALASLEKQISNIELVQGSLRESIKSASSAANEISSFSDRFAQLDEALSTLRTDLAKSVKLSESQSKARETHKEKLHSIEIEALKKELEKARKDISGVKDLKKSLALQSADIISLSSSVAILKNLVEKDSIKIDETAQAAQSYLLIQKRDAKRSAEIQGQFEVTQRAIEEQIARINLTNDTVRKLDAKLADYQAKEGERHQTLISTIDKAKIQQVDQRNQWKEWETRFGEVEENSKNFQSQMMTLEVMMKDLKKVQSTFNDMNEKLDRRINEITEMQRLGDDRIRKEWMNFKADDQKRWTAFTLSQEELHRGRGSEVMSTKDKLQAMDDEVSQIKTTLGLLGCENQKQFRMILDVINNLLEANDRTLGKLDKKV